MGFFGNTTYFLNEAFDKLTFSNAGKTIYADSSTLPNNMTFFPQTEEDELIIESGNKWVKFENTNGNKVKIFHAYPDSVVNNQTPVNILHPVDSLPNGKTVQQLGWDDILTGAIVRYDKAGHVAAVEDQYFKLPKSASEQDFSNLTATMQDITTLTGNTNLVSTVNTLNDAMTASNGGLNNLQNRINSIENLTLNNQNNFQRNMTKLLNLTIEFPNDTVNDSPSGSNNTVLKVIRQLQADLATKNLAIQALEARITALENT